MTFDDVLEQVIQLLQRQGRVSYRALKRRFTLDDNYLEDLKEELIYAQRVASDEEGRILVWTSDAGTTLSPVIQPQQTTQQPAVPTDKPSRRPLSPTQPTILRPNAASSRCCSVTWWTRPGLPVSLTRKSCATVVRAYQDTCAKVIARFEGHIAQYLGDGLLVYFGYPLAHEDDAQRAVRAGLGMIEALGQLNTRLAQEAGGPPGRAPGIHTGLVVVGDVGGGARQEQFALGETPNLAAGLQGIAAPNTLVISATTLQLLGGFFVCQPIGTLLIKGFTQPLAVYHVLYESMARSRLEAVGTTGVTPLVAREQEIRLLQERWAQVKEGLGQVVLLSGEAGIGKSRLVQVLKEHVATESQAWRRRASVHPITRIPPCIP